MITVALRGFIFYVPMSEVFAAFQVFLPYVVLQPRPTQHDNVRFGPCARMRTSYVANHPGTAPRPGTLKF